MKYSNISMQVHLLELFIYNFSMLLVVDYQTKLSTQLQVEYTCMLCCIKCMITLAVITYTYVSICTKTKTREVNRFSTFLHFHLNFPVHPTEPSFEFHNFFSSLYRKTVYIVCLYIGLLLFSYAEQFSLHSLCHYTYYIQ